MTALLPQLVKTIERAEEIKNERLEAEKAEKALKSSRNRPDVGQKHEATSPTFDQRSSDAASEVTMIEPILGDLKKKKVQFTDDCDRCSMNSIDSMDDRHE